MSSMMRKLANQINGTKKARQERHMKSQMAKALAKVVQPTDDPPNPADSIQVTTGDQPKA